MTNSVRKFSSWKLLSSDLLNVMHPFFMQCMHLDFQTCQKESKHVWDLLRENERLTGMLTNILCTVWLDGYRKINRQLCVPFGACIACSYLVCSIWESVNVRMHLALLLKQSRWVALIYGKCRCCIRTRIASILFGLFSTLYAHRLRSPCRMYSTERFYRCSCDEKRPHHFLCVQF